MTDFFFWQEIVRHPNHDQFWQSRAVAKHLTGVKHAVLAVGGWFDAEDLYGPLTVSKNLDRRDPDADARSAMWRPRSSTTTSRPRPTRWTFRAR